MLANATPYLKVSEKNESHKQELASGVFGAVFLYGLTCVGSIWYIQKAKRENMGFMR